MEYQERALASIQKVLDIIPIEGADAIELAVIKGWQCIVKKGEFKQGDTGVFFEVDSFLPIDERYEFVRKSSYRQNEYNGEGFRIKTMKLRGAVSQGLFMPLPLFPELEGARLSDDVTGPLNVRKWTVPEFATSGGVAKDSRPAGAPTSDEIRIQSDPALLEMLTGRPYYITTKMDGTSGTVYYLRGELGACSRNYDIAESKDALYWKPVFKYGLADKLPEYIESTAFEGIVLIGEIVGPGVQKNRLGLAEIDWYVFDAIVFDVPGGRYVTLDELKTITDELALKLVPVEEEGEAFNYSVSELIEKANGKYSSGKDKEGIVVRSAGKAAIKDVSFKVLNNEFLLKEG